METVFEFLFKYRPLIYERGSFALSPPWPEFMTWVFVATAIVFAWFLYRGTRHLELFPWRMLLVALRSLALLTVLVVFLQPVLRVPAVMPQRSFVAVAFDMSRSMEIRDTGGGRSRLETERDLLLAPAGSLATDLSSRFKLRYFRFSDGAERTGLFEDRGRHGGHTDLGRSLDQILSELDNIPVSGIVLLTDGADNRSAAGLRAATERLRTRRVPVYAIGIGSPRITPDVEIIQVTMPGRVLPESMVEANVTVRASGFAGRNAQLIVSVREREILRRTIALGGDGEARTCRVAFGCGPAGARVITFRAEPLPGELISENNQTSELLRVEDEQPQVLYVEGEPRWIYGFLRRAALEDGNLRLVTLLRQADGKFLRQGIESGSTLEKGFPAEASDLFRYKAVIFGSVEASFFTFDQLRLVSEFVSRRGGGLLMLGGRSSFGQGGYVDTPMEELLPLSIRFGQGNTIPAFDDREFRAQLTSYGLENPATRVAYDEAENRKQWDAAPSLAGINPTSGPRLGATVLATAGGGRNRGPSPVLLAFQRFGRGKSMALTTASTWRWRMERDHRDYFHDAFWKHVLRWLVSDAPDPVTVGTTARSCSLDEPVTLSAEVNDPEFLHVNNARVTANVRAPSGQIAAVTLNRQARREGEYSAIFKPAEEGTYDLSAEAFVGEKPLGRGSAGFRVAESTEEFHDAALNSDLLKSLARDTGGRYYSPARVGTLPDDISYIDNGVSRIEVKPIWDMPFIFLLLAGTISAEWVVRKKKGLA
jgi:uncharacterized membrane protein